MKRPIILVAEDNPADVYLIRAALQESVADFTLAQATDGRVAIDMMNDHLQPNLVTLDLNMPRVDGFEVLDYIRNRSRHRTVPVIILTSSDSVDDMMRAHKLKATAYIRKPSTLDEFLEIGHKLAEFL